MIEEPSLQALVDISQHPTLSKRLTEVIISTDVYVDEDGSDDAHKILVSTGIGRDMLSEALSNVSATSSP